MNVTSPDITTLLFEVLYDLTGVLPSVSFTNLSTGPSLGACIWWVDVTTPSGTYIHQGDPNSPDKTGTWSNYTIPPGTWPMPMKQVEWSGINYTATLYVKDSANQVFSYGISTRISRPFGSTIKGYDNFGVASLMVDMQCAKSQLYVEDKSNYSYNGIAGIIVTRTYTLVYPMDPTGVVPAAMIVPNQSTVTFPVTFSDPCYQLILQTTMDYDFGDGSTVRIKYKKKETFGVTCDIDLAPLMCELDNLYSDAYKNGCDKETERKMIILNGLLAQVLIGKYQPLSGIDVAGKVAEIKRIGGFDCDCHVGAGMNGSNPFQQLSIDVEPVCGDIRVVDVLSQGNNFTIRLADTSYVFEMDPTSDLPGAFTIGASISPDACLKTYYLKVDSEVFVAGIQALLVDYRFRMDPQTGFASAFQVLETFNTITNTKDYRLKINPVLMLDPDPNNALYVSVNGQFSVDIARILTIINNDPTLNAYFCNICPQVPPIVCNPVTNLQATIGAYDPAFNGYKVDVTWDVIAGAINYDILVDGVHHTVSAPNYTFYAVGNGSTAKVISVTTECSGDTSTVVTTSVTLQPAPVCGLATNINITYGNYDATNAVYHATVQWTAGAGAISYTVTINGSATTITGTSRIFDIAPNTAVTVSIVTNCAGGTTSNPATKNETSPQAVFTSGFIVTNQTFDGEDYSGLFRDAKGVVYDNTSGTYKLGNVATGVFTGVAMGETKSMDPIPAGDDFNLLVLLQVGVGTTSASQSWIQVRNAANAIIDLNGGVGDKEARNNAVLTGFGIANLWKAFIRRSLFPATNMEVAIDGNPSGGGTHIADLYGFVSNPGNGSTYEANGVVSFLGNDWDVYSRKAQVNPFGPLANATITVGNVTMDPSTVYFGLSPVNNPGLYRIAGKTYFLRDYTDFSGGQLKGECFVDFNIASLSDKTNIGHVSPIAGGGIAIVVINSVTRSGTNISINYTWGASAVAQPTRWEFYLMLILNQGLSTERVIHVPSNVVWVADMTNAMFANATPAGGTTATEVRSIAGIVLGSYTTIAVRLVILRSLGFSTNVEGKLPTTVLPTIYPI